MKKIAIVGGGEIGTFLAERLTAENIDVTVIDRDTEVLGVLQSTMDVGVYLGNATSVDDLRSAGIGDADLFIATTRQDETNLISCLLAGELGIPHKIAITRYIGGSENKQTMESRALGIDRMINSSEAVTKEIMETVETTGASEVARFAEGQIVLVGYDVGELGVLSYLTVGELCNTGDEPRFSVAAIIRDGKVIAPQPEMVFRKQDYIYLVTTARYLPELNQVLEVETIKSRTAVIYGDNYLSQMLGQSLLHRHFNVTMLASSEDKARLLRRHFENQQHIMVEMGEGLDVRLLRRVKVPSTSVFIATSSDDASNLTACMIAKSLGVGKTVATIKRTDLAPLCRKVGVDAHIAPRLATARLIQQMVHENKVLDYKAVTQTNLEVVELEAKKNSKMVKKPLGEIKLPEGVVVGGIASNGGSVLPTPKSRVKPGDKVILLIQPEMLPEMEEYFEG